MYAAEATILQAQLQSSQYVTLHHLQQAPAPGTHAGQFGVDK